MFVTIKDLRKLISLYIKIIQDFRCIGKIKCASVTLYLSNHKIRDAYNISKYRLLQRWNRFINAPNPWKYQTRTATTDLLEKRGEGDEVLELPIGILQDDTGQVVGNERTHPIRTLSHNNNTTTRLKRGPNPLSGVLTPRLWEVVILSLLSMSPSSPQATERSLSSL